MRIPWFPRLLFFPLCLILLRELGFCIFSDLCVSLRKLLSIPAFSNPKIENGYLFFIYIPSDNKYLLSALCCLLEISIPFSENLCVCIYSSTVLFTKEYAFLSGMIFMWILLSLLNKCFPKVNVLIHTLPVVFHIWNTFIANFLMYTNLVAIKYHLIVLLFYIFHISKQIEHIFISLLVIHIPHR